MQPSPQELFSEGHENDVSMNLQTLNIINHHEQQNMFLKLQCRFLCTSTLINLNFIIIKPSKHEIHVNNV
jgi:hypothetical protein